MHRRDPGRLGVRRELSSQPRDIRVERVLADERAVSDDDDGLVRVSIEFIVVSFPGFRTGSPSD